MKNQSCFSRTIVIVSSLYWMILASLRFKLYNSKQTVRCKIFQGTQNVLAMIYFHISLPVMILFDYFLLFLFCFDERELINSGRLGVANLRIYNLDGSVFLLRKTAGSIPDSGCTYL